MAGTNSPERDAVIRAYSSPKWEAKVNKMNDDQVFAIYARLKAQGKI